MADDGITEAAVASAMAAAGGVAVRQDAVSLAEVVGGGYGAFWRWRGRYRVCKGSRASKKSKTTALWVIYSMMAHPWANTLVVRKTANTLRDSCYSDLRWAAQRLHVSHLWGFTTSPLQAVYRPTGQTIFFRGLDDPLKLASISCPVGVICWAWLEEAYEIESESDFDLVDDVIRGDFPDGVTDGFKQLTLTFNPWSASSWLKSRFFDNPSEDTLAITTTYQCNEWLDDADRRRFEVMKEQNPTRYKVAGLGEWGIDGEVFFEEWRDDESHYLDRRWTHVIEPFEIPPEWKIYRGFDFGYARPFSVGWWAVDHDGRLYHILELYGCEDGQPNVGVKWTPDEIFAEVHRIETEHRWLKGRHIYGIADPSIWDASRGVSIAEVAERAKVYFDPGDNHRIPGWMQMHYRFAFDALGIPMMYVFRTCRNFVRTIPTLLYDDVHPEDIDTDLEDHIADMARYVCMARPIKPTLPEVRKKKVFDPLDPLDDYWAQRDEYAYYRT